MRFQAACLLTLCATAGHSLAAEATTYAGTIGKLPIIVELISADDKGLFIGRYAYLSKGIDIPLHGANAGKDGGSQLSEEQP